MSAKVLLASLALACVLTGTCAIKCSVCTTPLSDCESGKVADKYLTDCGDSEKYCLISTAEAAGITTVSRSCGLGICTSVGQSSISLLGVSTDQNCCDTENCNSARALLPALTMLLASLLFTALF